MINYDALDKTSVTINNKEYIAYIFKTEEEKEFGAKGLTELGDNELLLFDYQDDPQDSLTFWMESTEIPLDIVFVSEDNEVLQVFKGEPNSTEYLTCESKDDKISYVLELNQNSEIKKGDEVELENDSIFSNFPTNGMFVLNKDGTIQFSILGGERIMSRISSRKLIRLYKKALNSGEDKDLIKMGKFIWKEWDAQDNREPEFVESPS